ncbi:hypothetical protein GcM1_159013 [Golovinomyces cichoracearum]|uniref:Uncharacterized protein n=1 Tax=Golovinomyces cichoracearum TaxID=62708 RepID=A0A420J9J5_9PEZI|nr:hypothetical protein GcM1_159013 [Golovinomyces cichoracearum]
MIEMVDKKGKSRGQEGIEVLGNLKSTISASTIGLARSFLSGQSNRELSKNTISGLNGLGKLETLSCFPTRNLAQMEDYREYPTRKLIHSNKLHGISMDHSNNHVEESNNELSNFLDCLNFITLPQSSACQKLGSYSKSISTQKCTQNDILPGSCSGEQEHYDGEDIFILLSSRGEVENEIDFLKIETTLVPATYSGPSSTESDNQLDSQFSPLIYTDLSNRSTFNFVPNFEHSIAYLDQWQELQESYVEKVWKDNLNIAQSPQAINESPIGNTFTTLQLIAVQRLKSILNHL